MNKKRKLDKNVNQTPKINKPNENGGFYFSSSVKITEVDTGKVILKKRCN